MAYDLAVAGALLFGIFGFTFAYMSMNIDRESHKYIGWFFLFLFFLCFGLGVVTMAQAANDDGATNIEEIFTGGGLHLFMWPFIFMVFYFIIIIIWYVTTNIEQRGKNKYEYHEG